MMYRALRELCEEQPLCMDCNRRKQTRTIDYRHKSPIFGATQPALLEA